MRMRHAFLLIATAAIGCGGYDAPDEVITGSVVYTQQAPGSDFTPLRTYYLDQIIESWEDGTPQAPVALPASTAATIRARMTALGYTEVTQPPLSNRPPDSDVGMRMAYLQSNFTYYVSSGYCSIYWAYYACWPYWGYAGSYSTGTVLMLMLDTRVTPPTVDTLWAVGLYAVLRDSSISNTTVLDDALNRAFDQSPYLKTSAAAQ
jgi:Domain of unknown function (DUF4136)